MNSKFSVFFGVSIIIVGLLDFFFETNNVILFGVSISELIFSIITTIIMLTYKYIKSDILELLYIIPLIIFLSFCCFGNDLEKINIVSKLINSNITTLFSFLSFGLIFIGENINYSKEEQLFKFWYYKSLQKELDYSNKILSLVNDYTGKIYDKDGNDLMNELTKLFDEKFKKIKLEVKLLQDKKNSFTIDEIDFAYESIDKML